MLRPEINLFPSGRGAAPIHGVLWLDLKELKVKNVSNEVLQEAFEKLRFSQALDEYEITALERFTDAFVTCTRCISVAGKEAVEKAEEVNWHGHSSSCRKDGPPGQCRWKFPKFPLARTIFVDAHREVPEEEFKMDKKDREEILRRVMAVLVEEEGSKVADWEAKAAQHFEGRTAKMLERKWYNDLRKQQAPPPKGRAAKRRNTGKQ